MSSPLGLLADTISFSHVDGPGNRFVVFLQGCNFDCIACHNPQTIALHSPRARVRSVADVLVDVRRAAPFLSGITVSGGEATLQLDFVYGLFSAVRTDDALGRLSCMVDTNGTAERASWDHLASVMDGAMVDLKCLDPAIHDRMTGQPNDAVLDSIGHLHAIGKLYEVRLLLARDVNDAPLLLERTAGWLADIDPTMRVTLISMRPHGVRSRYAGLAGPSAEQMAAIRQQFAAVSDFRLTVV